jgi:hypothetical protein
MLSINHCTFIINGSSYVFSYTTTSIDNDAGSISTATITATSATTQAADGCSIYPKTSFATTMIYMIPTHRNCFATLKAASTIKGLKSSSRENGASSGICSSASLASADPEVSIQVEDFLDDAVHRDISLQCIGAWSGGHEASHPARLDGDFDELDMTIDPSPAKLKLPDLKAVSDSSFTSQTTLAGNSGWRPRSSLNRVSIEKIEDLDSLAAHSILNDPFPVQSREHFPPRHW